MKKKEARMPIAGAVVIPVKREYEDTVREKLASIREVTVKDTGPKGVAIVIEAPSVEKLKELSEEINQWEEVIGFELVYLNWE